MKQLMEMVGCAVVVLVFACCQGPREKQAGRTVLPPDIAGTWKAYDAPWEIVLSPEGTVVSAVIATATVKIRPNQTTEVEMKDGSISSFKAGDCIVEYTPGTRELFVSLEMEDIHIKYMDIVIDGNSTDIFTGPVSEDGKVWPADWAKIFDYGTRFPWDPNNVGESVLFEKVEE